MTKEFLSLIDNTERVARAIWDATPSHCEMTWDEAKEFVGKSPSIQQSVIAHYHMAGSAIKAMHPTPDRLLAKLEALPEYSFDGTDLVHKYAVIEAVKEHFKGSTQG